MNRKRILLAVLVGLFVLSVIYAFWAMPRQEQAPPRTAAPRAAAKGAAAPAGQLAADRLHLGLLAELPQPFPGAGRDIFRFHGGAPPVVEDVADVETGAPVAEVEPPPPPPPPPPPTPEQLLQAKVAGYSFLGFLDKRGVKTVFLASAGELFLVKAGDVFGQDKSLVAKEITDQELVIGSVSGPETMRVKLVENEPLRTMFLPAGGAGGASMLPGAAPGTFRPGGGLLPARRSVLQQRGTRAIPPPVEEEVIEVEEAEEEVQPPEHDEEQEEPPHEEAPTTEGNGNAK